MPKPLPLRRNGDLFLTKNALRPDVRFGTVLSSKDHFLAEKLSARLVSICNANFSAIGREISANQRSIGSCAPFDFSGLDWLLDALQGELLQSGHGPAAGLERLSRGEDAVGSRCGAQPGRTVDRRTP